MGEQAPVREQAIGGEQAPGGTTGTAVGTPVRVMLEHGRKKVVAVAYEWPGWERSGRSDEDALARLEAYRSRYAQLVARAEAASPGIAADFAAAGPLEVVDHQPAAGTTDYFGVSGRSATEEHGTLPAATLERRIALLEAAWAWFDELAVTISPELRQSPRQQGRTRDRVVRHTRYAEPDMARKAGVRTDPETLLDPDAHAARAVHRAAYVAGLRACNTGSGMARSWTLQFTIRRTLFHVLDHGWELQDKDLTGLDGGA